MNNNTFIPKPESVLAMRCPENGNPKGAKNGSILGNMGHFCTKEHLPKPSVTGYTVGVLLNDLSKG